MKRLAYPYFHVSALVDVHQPGDAKWRLELLGVPKERIAQLVFEDQQITTLHAMEAKGVRRDDNGTGRAEAFFDYTGIAKRELLIRQRRLVPQDHRDMLAMYAPKAPAPQAAPESAEVAA